MSYHPFLALSARPPIAVCPRCGVMREKLPKGPTRYVVLVTREATRDEPLCSPSVEGHGAAKALAGEFPSTLTESYVRERWGLPRESAEQAAARVARKAEMEAERAARKAEIEALTEKVHAYIAANEEVEVPKMRGPWKATPNKAGIMPMVLMAAHARGFPRRRRMDRETTEAYEARVQKWKDVKK